MPSMVILLLEFPKQHMGAMFGFFATMPTIWWEITLLFAKLMDFGVEIQFVRLKVNLNSFINSRDYVKVSLIQGNFAYDTIDSG